MKENNIKESNQEDYKELIQAALEVREKSHSPYSHFKVGAAVVTGGGKIFTGTNVENASFSATICAERSAFVKAVSEGEKNFRAVAITSSYNEYVFPCGVCRQFMTEFAKDKDIDVILALGVDDYKVYKLSELIPHSFTLK